MQYIHNQTGRVFDYIGVTRPQFCRSELVELRNTQTGNIERFDARTWTKFFSKALKS